MVEVIYRGDNRNVQARVNARLKPDCPEYWKYPLADQGQVQTNPNRTVTTVFNGGSQHNGMGNSEDFGSD
jgi:hypothetical protein